MAVKYLEQLVMALGRCPEMPLLDTVLQSTRLLQHKLAYKAQASASAASSKHTCQEDLFRHAMRLRQKANAYMYLTKFLLTPVLSGWVSHITPV